MGIAPEDGLLARLHCCRPAWHLYLGMPANYSEPGMFSAEVSRVTRTESSGIGLGFTGKDFVDI